MAFAMLGHSSQLLSTLTQFGDLAVGLSFMFVGGLCFKENLDLGLGFGGDELWKAGLEKAPHDKVAAAGDDPVATDKPRVVRRSSSTVLLSGFFHGLSLDGAPSLIPALTFGGWHGAFSFLVSYCVGTIGAMTGATYGVGESTQWLSKRSNNPDITLRRLSAGSSLFAVVIGLAFCLRFFVP